MKGKYDLHEITPNPKLQWPLKCVKVEKFLFWRPVTYFLNTRSVLPPIYIASNFKITFATLNSYLHRWATYFRAITFSFCIDLVFEHYIMV
jgi:hypothetical protein